MKITICGMKVKGRSVYICPKCNSNNVDWDDKGRGFLLGNEEMLCKDCGHRWS